MAIPNTRTTYLSDGGSTRPSQYTPTSFSGIKQTYPVAQGPTSTNTVSDNRRPIGASGYTAGSVTFDEGSKNTRPLTNRQRELVYKTYPVSTPKTQDDYTPVVPVVRGNAGGATAEETPAVSGGGGGGTSGQDDILEKIKSLLEEQKKQADSHYKTLYEQQLASNKSAWENNRNQINKNYVRTDRYLNNMYGDAVSGTGLSNRMRNYSNWNNNLTENQRNYTNNDASALASYNQGLSNNANTLAQGWYNYVLPVYTNRQQNIDDLDYRKYLMSLGLM